MGHSKKPGAPGRTTIPPAIVASVTARLCAAFTETGFDSDYDTFIIAKQCYLYVEVKRRRRGEPTPRPPLTRSSTTHHPLGRLKFIGRADEWVYQPYRWSDECWDEGANERGTPEFLMESMILDAHF